MPCFQTRIYVYAVIVVHIADTHTSIPVVLTTHIFLFFWGGGVVKNKVPVHALKTSRESGGRAVLVINLGTV